MPAMAEAAEVADISEGELAEVAEFLARQVRAGEPMSANARHPADRLRWLLVENPARLADVPLGWRIRSQGKIVGAALCIPFRVAGGGGSATALMFAKFFVDPPFRGMGLGLLMRFARLGKRYPLFVTSTNAIAGELFAKLGARQIAGMDHTMLGVRRLAPLAEELIYRRVGSPVAARILSIAGLMFSRRQPPMRKSLAIASMKRARSVSDIESVLATTPKDQIAIVRDRDYVHWRYFAGDPDIEVWFLQCDSEPPWMIALNVLRGGYRQHIRILNILDVWPPLSPEALWPLINCLSGEYRDRFDVIWLRSQPASVEAEAQAAGWRRHYFPAPLGWNIDSQPVLPDLPWYLMPGESE